MNYITNVTKRDIIDLFNEGIDENPFWGEERTFYRYYGRLEELDFLGRLYDLENIESYDDRFANAAGDIWQHTINNDDYPENWVFTDKRFGLLEGYDKTFLDFICEIFHPEVRDDSKNWEIYLKSINSLLQKDGYELYPSSQISGRNVYSWRKYQEKPALFIPFSKRNERLLGNKNIKLTFPLVLRRQLFQLLVNSNENLHFTDETGWNYIQTIDEIVFDNIKQFYLPKAYREGKYVATENLEEFILHTSPKSVLDFIEFFSQHSSDKSFGEKVNTLLKLNNINLTIANNEFSFLGKIIDNTAKDLVKERGLQELLSEANQFYLESNFSVATEKLWDAFERLKTFYSPTLNKKQSVEKIITQMSLGNKNFQAIFEKEFTELTKLGNDFRIRHHEVGKKDITNEKHFEYLYNRCITLISTAIKILHN
ncbi:hypothetical protein QQY70_01840 [Streptococcus suis]|uniref:AbiJ-related protein n=1 Tax=Streptococcus suis TaxID=1307 RepID=UPI0032E04F8E